MKEILPLRKLRVRISPGGSNAANPAQLLLDRLLLPSVSVFYCLPFALDLPA
jgi:hypothetical protein